MTPNPHARSVRVLHMLRDTAPAAHAAAVRLWSMRAARLEAERDALARSLAAAEAERDRWRRSYEALEAETCDPRELMVVRVIVPDVVAVWTGGED